MAWLRSALTKAAEVGNKNNLTRAVRSYAGAVYHQAAGGAKIFQDRLSGRNFNSFKDAVKRLNEVSLNARGAERLQALARWLGALKDIDKESKRHLAGSENADSSPSSPRSPDSASSPRKGHMALFYDFENGAEPMNFRDVFLESQALEHIATSMILEGPQDEEIGILSEIFGLCLAGGQELHKALISSIQDLAKAFSTLSDEVKIGRSQLLEMAQTVITGLKLNPESERLDAEVFYLQQTIAARQGVVMSKDNEDPSVTEEVIECGARIRTCLRRKEELLVAGDTEESRTEKVNKLKEVTEGLGSSITEIEQKISDNKQQKDKAMKYRDTKALEVHEQEKAVALEVQALQKRKEELEAQLKEVNTALSIATARHIHLQEEKEQFDDASSNIIAHLTIQEEELLRSIAARKAESMTANTWIGFLEDSWLLQTSCQEEKTKDVEREIREAKQQFLSIASINLSYLQEETTLLLKHCQYFSELISKNNEERSDPKNDSVRTTREKYLDIERQVVKVLQTMDRLSNEVKAFGLAENGDDLEKKLLKNLEAVNHLNSEFKELRRPELDLNTTGSPNELRDTEAHGDDTKEIEESEL